jgi:ABC-type lipoprotein export system ATPase subunit
VCKEWGATVLLASHDPEAATFADQRLELRDGQIREYTPITLGDERC